MSSLAGFAAFARKVGVVPHVPQPPQTWGTGSEPGNSEYIQDVINPVPHVPHVPPQSAEGWDEEDWQAAFDERAGILEYDEGLTRAEAEALAREQVFRQWPCA